MSTKTTYICDSCKTTIEGSKTAGPFTIAVNFGSGTVLNRVFGTKDSHLCGDCLTQITNRYQDLINSIGLEEVK
jgi:hypothetical protein